MTPLKNHFSELFKTEPLLQPPWPRMILCAFSMGLPLLTGFLVGNVQLAIYGALTGYLLALNDHLGTLKHRLWITNLTFILLQFGFIAGFFLRGHVEVFQIILAAVAYWLGILGGDGAELERGVLFSVIGMVLIYSSPAIPVEIIPTIIFYCLLGFTSLILGIPLLNAVQKRPPEIFKGLRESLQLSLTTKNEKHMHAACYTAMVLLSLYISEYLKLERGYWVTMTVLLVMRAERTLSIYKTLQRLLGTAFGVLFCDLIVLVMNKIEFYILLGILGAFTIPWALKKNYLYASFFMTLMIVSLLEISLAKFGDFRMPFLRLQATLIGCLLSLLGSLLSKILSYVPLKQRT